MSRIFPALDRDLTEPRFHLNHFKRCARDCLTSKTSHASLPLTGRRLIEPSACRALSIGPWPSAPAAEIELPLKSGNLMLGAMAEDG
eukprot:COSAG01_NODE_158_length_23708_cov_7.921979_20_plen_87_part_00